MKSNLYYRVLVGVIAVPSIIITILYGKLIFGLFIAVISFVALIEFYKITNKSNKCQPCYLFGIPAGLLILLSLYINRLDFSCYIITSLILLLAIEEIIRRNPQGSVTRFSNTVVGVIYVCFMFGHLLLLRELPYIVGSNKVPGKYNDGVIKFASSVGLNINDVYFQGSSYVLFPFILVWVCDIFAYFVGVNFGKHKLIPSISPKKSVEGAIGGFVFTVITSVISKYTFAPYLSLTHSIILGSIVGIVSQLGDLFESALKRDADIKDTSSIIPGHGGVLDRFDSLMLSAPVVYYYLRFIVLK